MHTLLLPLTALKHVVQIVHGMPAAFEQTFCYRKAICTHVRYLAMTISCPTGTLYVEEPRQVEGGALWWDDDMDEMRELNRPGGIVSAPTPDQTGQERLDFLLDITSRAWKDHAWGADADPLEDLAELLERDDPRVKRFRRTKVKSGMFVRDLGMQLVDDDEDGCTLNMAVPATFLGLLREAGLTIYRGRWRTGKVNRLMEGRQRRCRGLLMHLVVGDRENGRFHIYVAQAGACIQ